MSFTVINNDCKDAMRELIAQGVEVDSIVTDPPYEIGIMGKSWDKTGIAYDAEMWELCLKLLKPGGHLLAFSSARTYHRIACAIENAGFEIRDQIMWVYGNGFPKGINISKHIDKELGYKREKINIEFTQNGIFINKFNLRPWIEEAKKNGFHLIDSNIPVTDAAENWQGWGSALKPAHEPIVLARKPLSEATIAANVLKHGTGAINIDGCRVGNDLMVKTKSDGSFKSANNSLSGHNTGRIVSGYKNGRFPANLIHDGSEEVEAEFAKHGESRSGSEIIKRKGSKGYEGGLNQDDAGLSIGYGDIGVASRFFYCAKASKAERNGSKHPTVKPLKLMRYLCRLITPPGGLVLDPFAGTGTTGQAAVDEGFNVILIEKNEEYLQDIYNRKNLAEQKQEIVNI